MADMDDKELAEAVSDYELLWVSVVLTLDL